MQVTALPDVRLIFRVRLVRADYATAVWDLPCAVERVAGVRTPDALGASVSTTYLRHAAWPFAESDSPREHDELVADAHHELSTSPEDLLLYLSGIWFWRSPWRYLGQSGGASLRLLPLLWCPSTARPWGQRLGRCWLQVWRPAANGSVRDSVVIGFRLREICRRERRGVTHLGKDIEVCCAGQFAAPP